MDRIILHSDANCFYASCEIMENPKLRGKPVAVCGSEATRSGIVLTRSYEAKPFGVTTGDAIWQAKQKCPDLIIVEPHYELYMQLSDRLHEIYGRFTDQVEGYGLDECWLDVTGSTMIFGSGMSIAQEIRNVVKRELGITVSIGVSFNKATAKIGSDYRKPDAITEINRSNFREIVWPLPVEDLFYVGRATQKKLNGMGIHTIGDLARFPEEYILQKFGKHGKMIYGYATGFDSLPVVTQGYEFPVKSVGHGMTSVADLENNAEVWRFILQLCQEIGHRLRRYERRATGIAIAIRDSELFYSREYMQKLDLPSRSPSEFARTAFQLFENNYDWHKPIRQITLRAFDLVQDDLPVQSSFFTDIQSKERQDRIDTVVEDIRRRFGKNAITNAVLLQDLKMSPIKSGPMPHPPGYHNFFQ